MGDTEVAGTPTIAARRASYAVDSDQRSQKPELLPGLRPVSLRCGFAVERRDQTEKKAGDPWSMLDADRWSTLDVG